jgi:hypothetical protein
MVFWDCYFPQASSCFFLTKLVLNNCFLLLCWVGVHCGIYKRSYNISNISYLNTPPPHINLLYAPSPNSWNSFNRSHFPFSHMCTQYLHHSHPTTPFPHLLPLPLVPIPPKQDLFNLLFSNFVKEKKMTFLFV